MSLSGIALTSSQGVKAYDLSVILNRILSIGTIMANEKMLKTADRMFSTTEPTRYFLKGAMYLLIIFLNSFMVKVFWSTNGKSGGFFCGIPRS